METVTVALDDEPTNKAAAVEDVLKTMLGRKQTAAKGRRGTQAMIICLFIYKNKSKSKRKGKSKCI